MPNALELLKKIENLHIFPVQQTSFKFKNLPTAVNFSCMVEVQDKTQQTSGSFQPHNLIMAHGEV